MAFVAATLQAAPGDLDLRFGQQGVLFVGNGGLDERIDALLPDEGNAVFAAGQLYEEPNRGAGGYDMTVLRLLADGSLDPGFGDGGYAQVGLGGDSEFANAILRQTDGKLLLAGALEPEANTDFGIARLLPGGQPDTTFGDPVAPGNPQRRGNVHFNMGPTTASNDEARAIALQSDGRIVVAGVGFATEGNFTYARFALARLTADGTLDATFGSAGRVFAPATGLERSEYVTAIALRSDGKLDANDGIVVAGYAFARNTAIVRRYLANGAPDPNFGTGGLVTFSDAISGGQRTGLSRIDDAVIQRDGKIVLVGRGGDRGFAFLRLLPNGTLDTTFGVAGRMHVKFSGTVDYDEPSALTLQADGKIVAAGYATGRFGQTSGADFASVRLRANGQPDSGYGDGQGRSSFPLVTETDEAFAVAVLSDGSLLFAGGGDIVAGSGGNGEAAFLRLQGDPGLFSDGFEN
jgi:uncharacterized delta-60 repeat protein